MTTLPATLIIVLACLLAMLRLCRQPRPPLPRLALLLALQPVLAGLLWLVLFPPPRPLPASTLLIASAGTRAADVAHIDAGQRLRLPEAAALPGFRLVPDLASALRQYPQASRVVVAGHGLPARDRDLPLPALRWLPGAAARGLVELQAPPVLAPSARFEVGTRVQGVAQAKVELLDPAGQRVASASPDRHGRVRLQANARAAGDVEFVLRALDADGNVVDQLPVPVRVREMPAPRLLLLAGAPGPEPKYLQRWAQDSGANLQTGISVGGGLQLGDAPPALDAGSLAKLDLLMLDERRLAALPAAQRAAIGSAARNGLGVLVRLGGPPDVAARHALREWGLELAGDGRAVNTTLADVGDNDNDATAALNVETFNLQARGNMVAALLHAADGSAIGAWRSIGQGRIGVLPLADSHALVLQGRADAHAWLWNRVLQVLARPLPGRATQLPAWGWAGERTRLCGLPGNARIRAPDGSEHVLVADPAAGNCAGWWPRQAGWHHLLAADTDTDTSILVLAAGQAVALHAQGISDATAALQSSANPAQPLQQQAAGSRLPWLLAFLLAAALAWWLERRHWRPGTR